MSYWISHYFKPADNDYSYITTLIERGLLQDRGRGLSWTIDYRPDKEYCEKIKQELTEHYKKYYEGNSLNQKLEEISDMNNETHYTDSLKTMGNELNWVANHIIYDRIAEFVSKQFPDKVFVLEVYGEHRYMGIEYLKNGEATMKDGSPFEALIPFVSNNCVKQKSNGKYDIVLHLQNDGWIKIKDVEDKCIGGESYKYHTVFCEKNTIEVEKANHTKVEMEVSYIKEQMAASKETYRNRIHNTVVTGIPSDCVNTFTNRNQGQCYIFTFNTNKSPTGKASVAYICTDDHNPVTYDRETGTYSLKIDQTIERNCRIYPQTEDNQEVRISGKDIVKCLELEKVNASTILLDLDEEMER